MTISLESLQGMRRTAPRADPETERLNVLFHQYLDRPDAIIVDNTPPKPRSQLQAIYDALTHKGSQENGEAGNGHAALGSGHDLSPQAKRANLAALDGPVAETPGVGGDTGTANRRGASAAAGGGGLWGQVEWCWAKLPMRSPVLVTLVVRLDAKGGIVAPPTIIRPSGAYPDRARLIAEAKALAALVGCVPYRTEGLGASQATFTINFDGRGPNLSPKKQRCGQNDLKFRSILISLVALFFNY